MPALMNERTFNWPAVLPVGQGVGFCQTIVASDGGTLWLTDAPVAGMKL